MRKRIVNEKGVMMLHPQIIWALHTPSVSGNMEKAFDLLSAIQDAAELTIVRYDPDIKLLGAENRNAVSCYLDSVLFAMFSRLDTFEAMLYNSFDETSRDRLAFLLRVWVNLLRMGKLVTTDITRLIQEALAGSWMGRSRRAAPTRRIRSFQLHY